MRLNVSRSLQDLPIKPFLVGPVLLCFLLAGWNCRKGRGDTDTKPIVTIGNLQTAYAKSMEYCKRYSLFVLRAKKERQTVVANLFRAIARSEEIRAANHAKLLRSYGVEPIAPRDKPVPVGATVQTLKMALSSEDIQYDEMYPNMVKAAELEKSNSAAEQFRTAREIDAGHRELFFDALNSAGRLPRMRFFVCSSCGCVLTSDTAEQCPVCHGKKALFEEI